MAIILTKALLEEKIEEWYVEQKPETFFFLADALDFIKLRDIQHPLIDRISNIIVNG